MTPEEVDHEKRRRNEETTDPKNKMHPHYVTERLDETRGHWNDSEVVKDSTGKTEAARQKRPPTRRDAPRRRRRIGSTRRQLQMSVIERSRRGG